jgi:hypothetical protein
VARWNELKFMEDEKWREKLVAQVKMMEAEERMLALEDMVIMIFFTASITGICFSRITISISYQQQHQI